MPPYRTSTCECRSTKVNFIRRREPSPACRVWVTRSQQIYCQIMHSRMGQNFHMVYDARPVRSWNATSCQQLRKTSLALLDRNQTPDQVVCLRHTFCAHLPTIPPTKDFKHYSVSPEVRSLSPLQFNVSNRAALKRLRLDVCCLSEFSITN